MCKLKHAAYVLCTTLLGSCGCLVAVPRVWEDFPGNINNPAEVAAGTHPPDYQQRSRCCYCGEQAGPGQALCLAYTTAISTLNLALLASVGADNKTLLKQSIVSSRPLVFPYPYANCGGNVAGVWGDNGH